MNRWRMGIAVVRRGSVLCCLGLLIFSNCGAAQTVPASTPAAPPGPPLPDAPLAKTSKGVRSGANGAPEKSNAAPQVKQSIQDQSDDQDSPAFSPRHLFQNRYWISGQSNFIFQAHTPFHSPYSGPNSFRAAGQTAVSRTVTVYTGVRLLRFTEAVLNFDEAGGRGLSDGLGIAGYVNADVVDPDISRSVFLSRSFLHQTFALTADRIEEEPNPYYLQPSIPRRRLEFTFGKFSLLDFFDVNEVGSDSHLQFTNVALGNNGPYEVAGDAHGFTVGAMLNYQGPKIGIRFAEALLPKFTGGSGLDYDLRHARAENLEFDYATYALRGLSTHVRALGFLNHADLGNYQDANAAYMAGRDTTPDITAHRHQDTAKPGIGINFEQDLPANFRTFFRAGWNDGKYESFTFSEMNQSLSFGGDLSGDAWHRKDDRIGSAWVFSGLSRQHREYLSLGGLGFELGDGALSYGHESVSETYYNAHVVGGLYLASQFSFVNNPGFNRDRGPIVVPGLRAHLDF